MVRVGKRELLRKGRSLSSDGIGARIESGLAFRSALLKITTVVASHSVVPKSLFGGFMSKLFVSAALAVLLLFTAFPAGAQTYPMPGSAADAPVYCTGCLYTNAWGELNAGLKTYPYSAPFKAHVGRVVDSNATNSYQNIGFRTARAGLIRIAPSSRGTAPARVYMGIGEAIAGYRYDTFFTTQLPSGMVPISNLMSGVGGVGRNPVEQVLPWGTYLYPEKSGSGWIVPLLDGNKRLFDFDFDDRGYVYGAYYIFGWGIVRDEGSNSGAAMPKVVQVYGQNESDSAVDDTTDVTPKVIVSIKTGGRYYAAVSNSDTPSRYALWDVTNPSSPTLEANRVGYDRGFVKWAKDDEREVIAIVGKASKAEGRSLRIYTYAAFVSGAGPLLEVSPDSGKYIADFAFDENGNLWAAESSDNVSDNVLWRIKRSGTSYQSPTYHDVYGPTNFSPRVIAAGSGYIAVAGYGVDGGSTATEMRLIQLNGDTPSYVDTDAFFRKYYHYAPQGFAQPYSNYTNFVEDIELVAQNGKTYLLYNAFGMGDVYEIGEARGVTASMLTSSFGTTNPNARPDQTGPFPGDVVKFRSSSLSGSDINVTWDFGNAESGTLYNITNGTTGQDVTHQFSGLNTTTKVQAAKTVVVTADSDSTLKAQVGVNLKVPKARVTVPGITDAVLAAPSERVELVAGDVFKDASDGSIESHVAIWTIDGSATNKLPNETMSVGSIGQHELDFSASYGRYDAGSLAQSSPFVTGVNNILYEVKPFVAAISNPVVVSVSSEEMFRFSGTARKTSDGSVMSATQWTVTWTVEGPAATSGLASHAVIDTQTSTVTAGTIPPFDVPKAAVPEGSIVTLEIEVDLSGLSTPAQAYASYSDSTVISKPDPDIQINGCTQVGSPCSFTAKSVSGSSISDWTLAWTLKLGSTTKGTSSSTTYTPSSSAVNTAGGYSISLTATKAGLSEPVQKSFTLTAPACGSVPAQVDLSIDYVCPSGGCPTNQSITFTAGAFGATPILDCHTVSWNFGGGNLASGNPVEHSFSSSGNYNVSVTVSNGTSSVSKSTSVTVGSGGTSTCTAVPSTLGIAIENCLSGSTCRAGQSIRFSATRGTTSLLSCDEASWKFGDGDTSSTKSPTHVYAAAGTYTVEVTVDNTAGAARTKTEELVILPASTGGGSCALPAQVDLSIDFVCPAGGCPANQSITFTAGAFGAVPIQSCHAVSWNFGGGSQSTGNPVSHSFTTGGSHTVSVTVSNSTSSVSKSTTLTVVGGAAAKPVPQISFTSFPTTGGKGGTVTFAASSNLATTTGWTWTVSQGASQVEFDDSQKNATKQTSSFSYRFDDPGTFTVRVTARNSEDVATAQLGSIQNNITISDVVTYKFLLPVVVHAPGLGGSTWRTDLQVYNPDPSVSASNPLLMTAEFKGKTADLAVTKSTFIYEDFMSTLMHVMSIDAEAENGPVVITAKGNYVPQLWTRVYNVSATGGTFGQFIPAIRIDGTAATAETPERYFLAGLREDARHRVNVGFINPNATAITPTVKVYNEQHQFIGQFTPTLQPFTLDQKPLSTHIAPVALPADQSFSLEIELQTGQWLVAYASLIDNATNDPVTISAIREADLVSEDYRRSVIPGVGHVGNWRSDVTVFNPDEREWTYFDLEYVASSGTLLAKKEGYALAPLNFIQFEDVLRHPVFGTNVPDGTGMLRVNVVPQPGLANPLNTKNPLTYSRTYFDDGRGSYGQGIAGFATAKANVRTGKPALIPGVRGGQNYRTNVGLVNVSSVASSVRVHALDPSTGASAGFREYTLQPGQSVIQSDFFGAALFTQSTSSIKIELISGGDVWAFASVIDQRTSDPEYVEAFPLIP